MMPLATPGAPEGDAPMNLLVCACWTLVAVPDPPDTCLARLDGFPSAEAAREEVRRWRAWERRLDRRRDDTPWHVVDAWQERCREYARAWYALDQAQSWRELWESCRRSLDEATSDWQRKRSDEMAEDARLKSL